jgi:hypothetical protein
LYLDQQSIDTTTPAGKLMFPTIEKRIQAQLRYGKGMRKVARECGVGTGTVQRVQQEMEGPFVGAAA